MPYTSGTPLRELPTWNGGKPLINCTADLSQLYLDSDFTCPKTYTDPRPRVNACNECGECTRVFMLSICNASVSPAISCTEPSVSCVPGQALSPDDFGCSITSNGDAASLVLYTALGLNLTGPAVCPLTGSATFAVGTTRNSVGCRVSPAGMVRVTATQAWMPCRPDDDTSDLSSTSEPVCEAVPDSGCARALEYEDTWYRAGQNLPEPPAACPDRCFSNAECVARYGAGYFCTGPRTRYCNPDDDPFYPIEGDWSICVPAYPASLCSGSK